MGVYGRFLSSNKPTIAIAIMIATVEPTKYISVGGKATTGTAVGVGAASSTKNAVSAYEGQYDSDPAKVATTVYSPVISGTHLKLNIPLASLVAEPMGR